MLKNKKRVHREFMLHESAVPSQAQFSSSFTLLSCCGVFLGVQQLHAPIITHYIKTVMIITWGRGKEQI